MWTEPGKVCHFNEYMENGALKWYLTDVFDTDETWDNMCQRMIAHFGTVIVGPFRVFIRCRFKNCQTVGQYYYKKKCRGTLSEL